METKSIEPIPAPAHLSERAKALWTSVVPSRVNTPARLVLVQMALECLDRADQARNEIAKSGLVTTTKTTGAVHVNPLTKIESEATAQFSKIWSMDLMLSRDRY